MDTSEPLPNNETENKTDVPVTNPSAVREGTSTAAIPIATATPVNKTDTPNTGTPATPASLAVENGGTKRGAAGLPTAGTANNANSAANYPNKAKKRKRTPRDLTAPRQPLNGYVRFLNDNRDRIRGANPNLPFPEITKLLASEWSSLPQQEKQQYLNAAEQDKERYIQEMNAYKQTDAYKMYVAAARMQANKKPKDEPQKEDIKENEKESEDGFDIPIFTEDFLDHNKAREAELRQLRKSNTDYEQQNAILQKHMENMRVAVRKLNAETEQQRSNNAALQQHLQQLRTTLTASFANIPLPGTNQLPTMQTIDNYMSKLHTLLMDASNHQLAATVREIITNRMDLC
ncbi:high mobility group protein 20A isoform X2 [Nilaparvata lugens]|uniref:high mobility group protein 20A isoform X2 n=1 Tax=Nilaparvata lugens TaxID=108931 RepID=UPI000B9865B7|nr:high mobility group protein 20A isoform X2 [Nilaparvata lugens]XP_039294432.1 high mobility group protein 20A isoform X2 [Nilaparvata lugens]